MKDWVRHIQDWAGWTVVREWRGWRRYGPAAGSVVAHSVVGVALIAILGASVKPRPAPPPPAPSQLQITLVAETPQPMRRPPSPRPAPRPRAAPDADVPERPPAIPRKTEKQRPDSSDDTVFVPPSIFADSVPLGLRGMASRDRCNPANGFKPKDCSTQQWSEKIPSQPGWQLASNEELRVFYGDVIPVCPYKVGCEPGEWISTNGTRSVFHSQGDPMMGGVGGLRSGAEGATERLGFNPDHRDPGFGN